MRSQASAALFEEVVHAPGRYGVIMWENIGTIHNAIPNHGPDAHRLIKRCQVMATQFAPQD